MPTQRILVTGLTTLHWGRMEFGNVGNYYIIAALFPELLKVFPDAQITTTLQLSDEFLKLYNLKMLPLESYYAWRENDEDLHFALEEYAIAFIYHETGCLVNETKYIKEVLKSELIIFLHGDMWGDNADANGSNRFFVDILKTRIAQLLGKRTVMLASSPGPVSEEKTLSLAKIVYAGFELVANREDHSKTILADAGFDVSKTFNYACPSFLFGKHLYPKTVDVEKLYKEAGIPLQTGCKNIGVIPSTYSFSGTSFDQWKWVEQDFESFIEIIEHIVNMKGDNVILIPHAYGFKFTPNFERIHWRDYKMLCQIYDLLKERGNIDMEHVFRLDSLQYPWEAHAFLGRLDMLVSGRVHGSVASLSQCVPTMAISYKSGPLPHKMLAFYELVGMGRFVVSRKETSFIPCFEKLYNNLDFISKELARNVPKARRRALAAFSDLKKIIDR
jgi:colanic acid/amylovoran biosynthesis protein